MTAIDLFCGLGGWTAGLLSEGYHTIGFDIERHQYGEDRYPAQLVLQDVLTIHGSQFRNATLIVASPPCQAFSYMSMPWSRAKQIAAALRGKGKFPDAYTGPRTIDDLNALFNACFRIQREACAAAGRYIPMVVENVKGAQPWVGPAKAHFGSFYLWGDVEMVGDRVIAGGSRWESVRPYKKSYKGFHAKFRDTPMALLGSKSPERKAISAQIAKIPLPLSSYIARAYKGGAA